MKTLTCLLGPWSAYFPLRRFRSALARFRWLFAVWLVAGAALPAAAQAPEIINHLGFVEVNGVPYTGSGQFKFAIVNAAGNVTHWSHDGTSAGGAAPASWVITNLVRGRYTIPLGDTSVANMTQPLTAAVVANTGLYLRVWFNDGVNGEQQLAPDQHLVSVAYALRAATVPDGAIGTAQLAAGAVQTSDILDGTVTSSDIANGTITTSDLNLASVDGRYVLKTGDTMTGGLTAPKLTAGAGGVAANLITNVSGLLSIKSRTDIELTIDNGGGAAAAFEIFNGAGSHLYLLSETGNSRTFGTHAIDNGLMVGTTALDANAFVQFNLPNSVSVPHLRIESALGDNGFGIQFANPQETWFVGPNIGNWPDDRFNILADSSNKGLIIAANGNVGIDSVSAASPFATLTIDGTIGFPTVSTPAMYVYASGTSNADKPLIVHSPSFPEYGLYYSDPGDQFVMKSSAGDTTPSLVVDLDSNWVTIATDTPKPGYELSVNGQIVCEELLVEDSADWPDYVFEDNYPLKPLAEVEAHIREKKHLPGIPTAAEVKRDGLPVGEMQKRMMEKIEELTLYVIEQNKRLAAQDERLRQLEAQVTTQEGR